MQDWVNLLTAAIQLLAAIIIYKATGKEGKQKGTKKRSRRGKRK